MITWNYHVFRESTGEYVIREVFYSDDGSILTCTATPAEPAGQTLEALEEEINSFREALKLPVLTLDEIPAPRTNGHISHREGNTSIEQILSELPEDEPSSHPEVPTSTNAQSRQPDQHQV
jgi:hypothetical protein